MIPNRFSTGGVLPGVTVTATNVESGNTFVAVSDERGNFRLPVRIGNYPNDERRAFFIAKIHRFFDMRSALHIHGFQLGQIRQKLEIAFQLF